MKTVKFHRYAQHSGTEIFNDPLGDCIGILPANSWIGISHSADGWYHVVTAHLDGWVRIEDCTTGKHVRLTPSLPVDEKDSVMNYTLRA